MGSWVGGCLKPPPPQPPPPGIHDFWSLAALSVRPAIFDDSRSALLFCINLWKKLIVILHCVDCSAKEQRKVFVEVIDSLGFCGLSVCYTQHHDGLVIMMDRKQTLMGTTI